MAKKSIAQRFRDFLKESTHQSNKPMTRKEIAKTEAKKEKKRAVKAKTAAKKSAKKKATRRSRSADTQLFRQLLSPTAELKSRRNNHVIAQLPVLGACRKADGGGLHFFLTKDAPRLHK
jgi:hypothetical protein